MTGDKTNNDVVFREQYAQILIRDMSQTVYAVALVDLADVERLSKFKWGFGGGFVNARSPSHPTRRFALKKFLLNTDRDGAVIVLNGDELDCRRGNLRTVDKRDLTALTYFRDRKLDFKYKITAAGGNWDAKLLFNGEEYDAGHHDSRDDAEAVVRQIASIYIESAWKDYQSKRKQ